MYGSDKERLWRLTRFNLLTAINPEDREAFNRTVKGAECERGETMYLPRVSNSAARWSSPGGRRLWTTGYSSSVFTIRTGTSSASPNSAPSGFVENLTPQ